jgi:alanine dehydrogenase
LILQPVVENGADRTVLLLQPEDLRGVVSIGEAIDLVEQGYREAAEYPLMNAPRRRVHSRKNVRLSSFPGGVDGLGVIGSLARAELVEITDSVQKIAYQDHPVYVLWDAGTARLSAIMIGQIVERQLGSSKRMALRTGATSGVGFRHLVRKDARTAGVIGTGEQAIHKVLALQNERDITLYKVYSRSSENRDGFCAKLRTFVKAEVIAVETSEEAVRSSDVIICATSSNVPVFDGEWLEPGQHVVSVVGSNSALVDGGWLSGGRRETDDRTAERASFIVTNWRESVEQERQASLIEPIEKGVISWDKVHELGDILTGKVPGRTSDDQITFHANGNGTAAADLAIAQFVYRRCRELGKGTVLNVSPSQ